MHLLESVVQSQLFNHIIGCLVSWYIQAHLNIVYTFDGKVVVFTYFSISLPTAEHSPSTTQPPVLHGHSSESLKTWLLSSPLQASQYLAAISLQPSLRPTQNWNQGHTSRHNELCSVWIDNLDPVSNLS